MFIVVGKFGALSTAIIIVTTTFPFPIPIRQMIRRVPTVFARIVCVRKTKTKLRIVHRSHCAVNETSKGLGHIFFRLPLPPAEDSLQGSPQVPSFFGSTPYQGPMLHFGGHWFWLFQEDLRGYMCLILLRLRWLRLLAFHCIIPVATQTTPQHHHYHDHRHAKREIERCIYDAIKRRIQRYDRTFANVKDRRRDEWGIVKTLITTITTVMMMMMMMMIDGLIRENYPRWYK